MKEAAYNAIERLWDSTVKARALCPCADSNAIGLNGYNSSEWYQTRGAIYFVNLAAPLKLEDVQELNHIGRFINRSFVISMMAVLEKHKVVLYKENPDRSKNGGNHVQLTKWLRNRFAHGEYEYKADNTRHVETSALMKRLFPDRSASSPNFGIPIDTVLEPLKDGVLAYIRAAP